MSIPKEKLIIQEIKGIVNNDKLSWLEIVVSVKKIVNDYVDPGYIGEVIHGLPEGPKN